MKVITPADTAQDASSLGQLVSARGLPSYVGMTPKYDFDPASGFYNLKASNMRKFHAGLIRAMQGTGRCNVLFIGDSSLIGYNGSVVKEASMIPRIIGETIAARSNVPYAGGSVHSVVATAFSTDRWSIPTGTANVSSYVSTFTLNANSSALWSPTQVGTEVHFLISNLSTNNFTYQIDGGAAVAVTTNATATWKLVSVTGLSYGTHTLRINCPAAGGSFVFFGQVMVTSPVGIACHNIAVGGSRASFGTVNQAWTNTGAGGPYGNAKQAWDMFGITPDLVVCCLGANDISSGDTVANAVAGLQTIRGWYASADFMLMHTSGFSGGTIANYDTYSLFKYALADTLDCPLFDIRTRMGDSTEAQANGLLGPDNAHGNDSTGLEIGRIIGGEIAAVFGGLSSLPQPNVIIPVSMAGAVTVRNGVAKIPIPTGTWELVDVKITASTVSSAGDIVVDLLRLGTTTLYAGGTGRPTVVAGASYGTDGSASSPILVGGEWIRADITSAGTGADTLTMLVELRRIQ